MELIHFAHPLNKNLNKLLMRINITHYFCSLIVIFFLFAGCNAAKEKNKKHPETANTSYLKQTADFIRAVVPKENYLLSDKPNSGEGFNCFDDLKADSFFTQKELDDIAQQSKQPLIKKWTTELVPTAKFVSADTISRIFNDNKKGWNYFYKNFGQSFSSYSAPIFLRNNTYCIFYTSQHCGWLCGGGRLCLYKREGNKWEIVKSYCNWIS